MRSFTSVKIGSTGTDVVSLQLALRMLRFTGVNNTPLEIDGCCGENTVHAINAFQSQARAYGYECGFNGNNDGVFGSACWKLLLGSD